MYKQPDFFSRAALHVLIKIFDLTIIRSPYSEIETWIRHCYYQISILEYVVVSLLKIEEQRLFDRVPNSVTYECTLYMNGSRIFYGTLRIMDAGLKY